MKYCQPKVDILMIFQGMKHFYEHPVVEVKVVKLKCSWIWYPVNKNKLQTISA